MDGSPIKGLQGDSCGGADRAKLLKDSLNVSLHDRDPLQQGEYFCLMLYPNNHIKILKRR